MLLHKKSGQRKTCVVFAREYRIWCAVAACILLLWGLITHSFYVDNAANGEDYLQAELETFNSKMDATLKTYEFFSNYFFEETVNRDEVLKLMRDANAAQNEAELAVLRERLYAMLLDSYHSMEKYNFRQFHFHLPDGESFLRFHKPEKFGDNLFASRPSVKIANTEKRYVSGFEEGTIFNGYRFVYPLSYGGAHIGSVEVSVSLSSLMAVLSDLYPEMNLYFIIEKEAVERTVFADQLDNYEVSEFSPDYYYDKEVSALCARTNALFTPEEKETIMAWINDEVAGRFTSRESFTAYYPQGEDYLFLFSAVESISGPNVGYLICVSKNAQYGAMQEGLLREVILVAIICVLFLMLSFIFAKNLVKVRTAAERDQLTRLFNRCMFLKVAEAEIERFKRYNDIFSIVMFDIDHFKRINDTYGHGKGDSVLETLADLVTQKVRKSDILARWGGEEFILLLPNTNAESALAVAEKIRIATSEHAFTDIKERVTVSLGIAEINSGDDNLGTLVERADKAMYGAKNEGRNRSAL